MRKIVLILACIICLSSFVGCVNKKAIKEQLCRDDGFWCYEIKSSNTTVYVDYSFEKDNTYWVMWIEPISGYEREFKGEYNIKASEIILEDETGVSFTTIEYSFVDGILKMIDKLEDGSGNYELVWEDYN